MKTMDDLRAALFDTIADLRHNKIEASTAKVVAELSQAVINTAKAEADFARATGQVVASGLIRTERPSTDAAPDPAAITRTPTAHGIKEVQGHITRHKLT